MSPDQYLAAVEHLKLDMAGGQVAPAVQALIVRLSSASAGIAEWAGAGQELMRINPAAAVALLDAGLGRWPGAITLRYLAGNAMRLCGRHGDAEVALRGVIAAEPTHADAASSLAYLLREQGRLRQAAEVIVQLWRNSPRSNSGDTRTVLFLRECQRHADADGVFAQILADNPQDARLHTLGGEAALALGRFGEAQRRFRAAIELDPSQAAAWLRLAHTQKFSQSDDPDLILLSQGLKRTELDPETRTCIGFGLGKALDDLAETVRAVPILRAANALQRARKPWDRQGWERFVEGQLRAPVQGAAQGQVAATPVFIVGLPRSGTTLVASLLARDAQVRNRSELNWISAFAARLGSQAAPAMLAAAGKAYFAQLIQDDEPARCYIDKNPLNFRHLGLIAAMLPQVRIVHCRRGLADTALSLWSQHFAHEDMAWAYAIADIAQYAKGYNELMQHWRQRLPVPVLDLDYEALVSDSGATLARLREFIGLAPTAGAASTSGEDAITTASVWQARQQVYASSVGRWKGYSTELPELAALVQ